MMIRITSIVIPQCLLRPVALQEAGEGMTPPLRKTTTNLTSVTVSTGHAAFLLLPLPVAPLFLVLPWLSAPSFTLVGSSSGACTPARMPALHHSHHLLLLPLAPMFLREESKREASLSWMLCSSLWKLPSLWLYSCSVSFTLSP